MKIRDLLEGSNWEKSVAAELKRKFAKMQGRNQAPVERPAPKDPHADKSTIWKKGFADGKAGKMDPKASDAYGPRTSEYEAGYRAAQKNENTASSVASSMGGGNGFVNGGPGTIKRRRNKKK